MGTRKHWFEIIESARLIRLHGLMPPAGIPAASSFTIADYAACRWPTYVPGGDQPGSVELAQWFDALNDGPEWQALLATRQECDVISFSHFAARPELLPEKRFLYFPVSWFWGWVFFSARVVQSQRLGWGSASTSGRRVWHRSVCFVGCRCLLRDD